MRDIHQMTAYLTEVAASVDNYCKYLNQDSNEYAKILGYVFRAHQDQIRKVSTQGLALMLIYLKDVNEDDYGKYIDVYAKKVDKILKRSNTLDEQFEKMEKLKKTIE